MNIFPGSFFRNLFFFIPVFFATIFLSQLASQETHSSWSGSWNSDNEIDCGAMSLQLIQKSNSFKGGVFVAGVPTVKALLGTLNGNNVSFSISEGNNIIQYVGTVSEDRSFMEGVYIANRFQVEDIGTWALWKLNGNIGSGQKSSMPKSRDITRISTSTPQKPAVAGNYFHRKSRFNNLQSAYRMGTLTGQKTCSGWVGPNNPNDYKFIHIKEKSNLSLTLRETRNKAVVELLNKNGHPLSRSSSKIQRKLSPGNYYIRVRAKSRTRRGRTRFSSASYILDISNIPKREKNHPPTVITATNKTVKVGAKIDLAQIFQTKDKDGDKISQYRVYCNSRQGDILHQERQQRGWVTLKSLSNVYFKSRYSGKKKIYFQAFDGKKWSQMAKADLTVLANHKPIVKARKKELKVGAAMSIADAFSVIDSDGDNPVKYQFRTDNKAYLTWSGHRQKSGKWLTISASDLHKVTLMSTAAGSHDIRAKVFDGSNWSKETQLTITSQSFARKKTLWSGESISAHALVPKKHTFEKFRFVDGNHAQDSGFLHHQGSGKSTDLVISVKNLHSLSFRGGSMEGSIDSLKISGYDGNKWQDLSNVLITAPSILNMKQRKTTLRRGRPPLIEYRVNSEFNNGQKEKLLKEFNSLYEKDQELLTKRYKEYKASIDRWKKDPKLYNSWKVNKAQQDFQNKYSSALRNISMVRSELTGALKTFINDNQWGKSHKQVYKKTQDTLHFLQTKHTQKLNKVFTDNHVGLHRFFGGLEHSATNYQEKFLRLHNKYQRKLAQDYETYQRNMKAMREFGVRRLPELKKVYEGTKKRLQSVYNREKPGSSRVSENSYRKSEKELRKESDFREQSLEGYYKNIFEQWRISVGKEPIVVTQDQMMKGTKAIAASSLIKKAYDPDGNRITKYRFIDNTKSKGSGYFRFKDEQTRKKYFPKSSKNDTFSVIEIEAGDLSKLEFVGAMQKGQDSITVEVKDNREWGKQELVVKQTVESARIENLHKSAPRIAGISPKNNVSHFTPAISNTKQRLNLLSKDYNKLNFHEVSVDNSGTTRLNIKTLELHIQEGGKKRTYQLFESQKDFEIFRKKTGGEAWWETDLLYQIEKDPGKFGFNIDPSWFPTFKALFKSPKKSRILGEAFLESMRQTWLNDDVDWLHDKVHEFLEILNLDIPLVQVEKIAYTVARNADELVTTINAFKGNVPSEKEVAKALEQISVEVATAIVDQIVFGSKSKGVKDYANEFNNKLKNVVTKKRFKEKFVDILFNRNLKENVFKGILSDKEAKRSYKAIRLGFDIIIKYIDTVTGTKMEQSFQDVVYNYGSKYPSKYIFKHIAKKLKNNALFVQLKKKVGSQIQKGFVVKSSNTSFMFRYVKLNSIKNKDKKELGELYLKKELSSYIHGGISIDRKRQDWNNMLARYSKILPIMTSHSVSINRELKKPRLYLWKLKNMSTQNISSLKRDPEKANNPYYLEFNSSAEMVLWLNGFSVDQLTQLGQYID